MNFNEISITVSLRLQSITYSIGLLLIGIVIELTVIESVIYA